MPAAPGRTRRARSLRGNTPARAHVEVELRSLDALLERGALIVLLDLAIVGALWLLAVLAGTTALDDGEFRSRAEAALNDAGVGVEQDRRNAAIGQERSQEGQADRIGAAGDLFPAAPQAPPQLLPIQARKRMVRDAGPQHNGPIWERNASNRRSLW